MATQLFTVIFISLVASAAWASEDEKKLLTKIFENYDTRVRPVEKNNDTLTVDVGVTLRKLIKVSPVTNTFEAVVWISLKWNDYQLKWNPEEYGGIATLQVPQNDIYKPDVVLFNSAKGMYSEQRLQPNKAYVTSDGSVMVVDSVKLTTDCPIDHTATEITCPIVFGSWTYEMSQIDLTAGTFGTEPQVITSLMWTVKGIKGKRTEKRVPKIAWRYVTITADVDMMKNKDVENIREFHEKASHDTNDI